MFIPLSKESFFIVVNYKVDKSQNASLDFTLSHLKINLCLPYILKLYQMLMDALANPSSAQQKPTTSKNLETNVTADIAIVIPPGGSTPSPTSPVPPSSQSTLKVKGKIELPEMILFAEPEKHNSKTLIMNTMLILTFESRAGVTELEIDLADLGIRLGENMNSSKRQGVPFLNPCSARVSMKQTDPAKPAQYKAMIESLYLNMTPTMYEVVMGVVNTINKTGTETVQKEVETKRLLEDSEPFVKHRINAEKYNYLNLMPRRQISELDEPTEGGLNMTGGAATPVPPSVQTVESAAKQNLVKLLETLELSIGELYITFCEETGLDLQPLAIMKLQLNGRVSNWTRNLHLKVNMDI